MVFRKTCACPNQNTAWPQDAWAAISWKVLFTNLGHHNSTSSLFMRSDWTGSGFLAIQTNGWEKCWNWSRLLWSKHYSHPPAHRWLWDLKERSQAQQRKSPFLQLPLLHHIYPYVLMLQGEFWHLIWLKCFLKLRFPNLNFPKTAPLAASKGKSRLAKFIQMKSIPC